jgi:hypothetical protein
VTAAMNLGLDPAQLRAIGRQEGATADDLEEALRRMRNNPRVLRGEVHSPGAFFRGILRGVLADRSTTRPAPPRPVPPAASPTPLPPPVDRTFGRMCLRAYHLSQTGADTPTVIAHLLHEFPSAPTVDVIKAAASGRALYRALSK